MRRQVVYLKIPVNRDGFVDPPSVKWSEEKEERLWQLLSNSKRSEVDWDVLSEEFGVGVRFLQQQAYWLYEKELESLRFRLHREASLSADTINEVKKIDHEVKREIFSSETSIADQHDTTLNNFTESASGSESESESDLLTELQQGSMLLHKSRILSKAPPQIDDLDEDEDEHNDEDNKTHEDENVEKPTTRNITTESSLSNLSSVSISKSALEEALLDNAQF